MNIFSRRYKLPKRPRHSHEHRLGATYAWLLLLLLLLALPSAAGCDDASAGSTRATTSAYWSAKAWAVQPDGRLQADGGSASDADEGFDAEGVDSGGRAPDGDTPDGLVDGAPLDGHVGTSDAPPSDLGPDVPDVDSLEGPGDSWSDDGGAPDGAVGDGTVADDGSATVGPARYVQGQTHSSITAAVAEHLQAIASAAPGRSDNVFMKVGASGTVNPKFLTCFAGGAVDWADHPSLAQARNHFLAGDAAGSDPFSRQTLAAKVGMSAVWAVSGDPSPIAAETAVINPRFALVAYGTNDMQLGTSFQSAMWNFANHLQTLVDSLMAWGIIPILQTNGARLDNPEADRFVETYNTIIRAVAQSRQIPLMDMWTVMSTLPNWGKSGDGLHLNTAPGGACGFDAVDLTYGYNARNLETLRGLERARKAVLEPESTAVGLVDVETGVGTELAVVGPPPLQGQGTASKPFVIDMLPFHHGSSTSDAAGAPLNSAIDVYPGCGSSSNQSGPERYYTLELETSRRLRFMVHDQGEVDVDLHILDASGTGEGCILRAHQLIETTLPAGTYRVVVDSWVDASGLTHSGDYLLGIVECHPDDSSCD